MLLKNIPSTMKVSKVGMPMRDDRLLSHIHRRMTVPTRMRKKVVIMKCVYFPRAFSRSSTLGPCISMMPVSGS